MYIHIQNQDIIFKDNQIFLLESIKVSSLLFMFYKIHKRERDNADFFVLAYLFCFLKKLQI